MGQHQPKLYKRTSTGATQTWWLELEGDRYRTHSGQLEGAITTSAWTQAKPKNVGRSNETSGEEQAAAEVASAYELKGKKGYLETPGKAQASTRFQCMLAKPYYPENKETPEAYARRMAKVFDANDDVVGAPHYGQPKLDGIRCIANAKGLWSRENNRIIAVPHVEGALKEFFADHPSYILDGELYNHQLKYNFNKIVSMVKKQKPSSEDLELSAQMVQYHIYDGMGVDQGEAFSLRYLGRVIPEVPWSDTLRAVGAHAVRNRQDFDALYESFLEEGYEGGMLRKDVPYETKRTFSLLKRKEKMDQEFVIIRFEEGVGNAAGIAKIAHMEIVIGGKKDSFKADICGTEEECELYLKHASKYVGKQATIEFQNFTPDGKPRFPKLKVAHLTKRW